MTLLRWETGGPKLHCVRREPNGPIPAKDDSLRWPLQKILDGVELGLRQAAELAPEGIGSIAVDGWAVDYVRLDPEGRVLEDPHCYRDERNVLAAESLHRRISAERLREITGVERQPINTLYQLYADKLSGRHATRWLNLPEYLLFRWGAPPVAEYTNATHTQLVDLSARQWSHEIFSAAGLDLACAPHIVAPGTTLGKLSGPLSELPALQGAELIAPACHDTASAVAGIAEQDDDWAYISCGTWSLVGTLLASPIDSPSVRNENFTNLGAVGGKICFHKGVNGMWILKQCMDHWAGEGKPWSLTDLLREAERQHPPPDLLSVDDPVLMAFGDLPSRINAQRRQRGLAVLSEDGTHAPAMVSLLLHSLASRYAEVIDRIRDHTRKDLRRIVMVGGGAQNAMLRRLTAERTGLKVCVGPRESATIGNLAVQCAVRTTLDKRNTPAGFANEVTEWSKRLGAATWQASQTSGHW